MKRRRIKAISSRLHEADEAGITETKGKHLDYITIDNQPDAILTSDWHLRETIPICRTDDFWKTQWEKVDFVATLQQKYDCPVLHAGDLFHHWKPSPYLISTAIEHLPYKFMTVYGQHDLPQHNFTLKEKSGIYVLEKAGKLKVLRKASWGQIPDKCSIAFELGERKKGEKLWVSENNKKILVWHKYNYIGKSPWPNCKEPTGNSLINEYKQFDLILTGDNHVPFTIKKGKRLLVNPGSLMRQDADQIDFKPRVYLWFAETNEVTKVYIPIKEEAVTREHIEREKEKENRIASFIKKLDGDWEAELSFEENLKRFIQSNRIRKDVIEIIYKAIENYD
jgi:DNA repair exonuclease SbcCD nuclease subunit